MKLSGLLAMITVFCSILLFGERLGADETENRALQTVRSYFLEALDGRQPEKVYALFAKDAEQYFNGYLKNIGIEAIYRNTEGAKTIFSDFQTEIHDITVKDRIVYTFLTHKATYIDSTAKDFPGGPIRIPTRVGPLTLKGQKVTWQAMARFEINGEGKIQKEWIVRDELGSLLTSGSVKFSNP